MFLFTHLLVERSVFRSLLIHSSQLTHTEEGKKCPEDWRLICCLLAVAAGEPGGPLHFKEGSAC